VAPPDSRPASPSVRSLEDIPEPRARATIEGLLAHPQSLGFLVCGSRATGWASPDADIDGFWYVTLEHYRSLPVQETQIRVYAEGEFPKRLLADISVFSDEVLEEQLASPLDIDHWPYVDAVILEDRGGRLEDWRRRIAAFPEEGARQRAMHKYLQLMIAYHEAILADVRGYAADRQLSLHRAALAGVHLWFTLRRRWAPPFKWWTREVERLEIRPDSRAVLEGALVNPTLETATHLRDHLKTEMLHAGIMEVSDVLYAFFETLLPENRAAIYRNSYL
jgi:hypothetical protein